MKDFSRIALRAFVACALVVGMMPSLALAEDASIASATEATSNAGGASSDINTNKASDEVPSAAQQSASIVSDSGALPSDGVRQDQSASQQDLSAQSDTSVAGEEGTSGGCSWKLDDNGNMTVWPTDGQSGTLGAYNFPWKSRNEVKTVSFKPGVKATGDCSYMFYDCNNLTSVDFSGLDTSQVTSMGFMFMQCYALSSLDLSGFDTSKVTDMEYMFVNCNSLTSVDVSSFDTSQAWSMRGMFSRCNSLTSLDVSKFDTSQVTDMTYMFCYNSRLSAIDVTNFNTSRVTAMEEMFKGCSSLTSLDLSSFDMPRSPNVRDMFYEDTSLGQIKVGDGFNFCGAGISQLTGLPYGYWNSADTGGIFTPEEIAVYRNRTADTYTKIILMHRLYNPYSGEHFYTASDSEKDNLVSEGWLYEQYGWTAPGYGDPVYRLYNRFAGEHHYTLDASEKNALVSAGWTDEGIGWYSDVNKTVPVYRQYNPYAFANNHNYTTDTAERDMLIGLGWQDESIAWYGM